MRGWRDERDDGMRRPDSLTPWLLAVLGFVSAVAPLAVDMYLASFTGIADDLASDASHVQLTLTAFLIGLGAGQLILGPLSDRWGRRPRSEEHTSELQSLMRISYAVFCLKKKKKQSQQRCIPTDIAQNSQ